MKLERSKFIFIGVLVYLVLQLLYAWAFRAPENAIGNWTFHTPDGKEISVTLPFQKAIDTPAVYRFTSRLPAGTGDVLVIPRPMGYALKVSVNGTVIGRLGDIANPTANIWNKTRIFHLFPSCRDEESLIEITSFGVHDTGLPFAPFVAFQNAVHLQVLIQNVLSQGVALLLIGMGGSLAVLLLILSGAGKRLRYAYWHLALSCVLIVIYNLDCVDRGSLFPLPTLLTFRKITLAALPAATALLFTSFYRFFKKERAQFWQPVLFFLPVIPLAFQSSFISLQQTFFAVTPAILLLILVIIIREWKRIEGLLLSSFIYFVLSTLQSVSIMFFHVHQPFMFSVGINVLITGFSFTLIKQMMHPETEIETLKIEAHSDPLTGVFNRKYFESLTLAESDFLVFFDVNKFKEINDTFGHARGDEILRLVARTLDKEVRRNDAVIRYGGDEFIIIFKNATEADCLARIEQILGLLRNLNPPVGLSYGIARATGDIQQTLALADTRMYEMKLLDGQPR